MPTRKLTANFIKAATSAGKKREYYWDEKLSGFALMVTENGARTFVVQYRNADGETCRMTISGKTPFKQARQEARGLLGDVAKGRDPRGDRRKKKAARAGTLQKIVEDEYLTDRKVRELRSIDGKKATFKRYIFPTLGSTAVPDIKRSAIANMFGKVERNNGPGAAHNAAKALSAFYTWYMKRADDDFVAPMVRGMYEAEPTDGSRSLSDDEVRILWNVTSEGSNAHDHFVRFTLLTGARRIETAKMPRHELSPDGMDWTIPAARYKTKRAHLTPLSTLAREVLAETPALGKNWVFTSTGTKPVGGFTNLKKSLDKRLHAALEKEGAAIRERIVADLNARYPGEGYQPFDAKWTLHSLRKTARTLLSRVKIDEPTAERCMGHKKKGIVDVYDHHEFKLEKRTAFEALAREIARIVTGEPAKVIPLNRRA